VVSSSFPADLTLYLGPTSVWRFELLVCWFLSGIGTPSFLGGVLFVTGYREVYFFRGVELRVWSFPLENPFFKVSDLFPPGSGPSVPSHDPS